MKRIDLKTHEAIASALGPRPSKPLIADVAARFGYSACTVRKIGEVNRRWTKP